MSTPTSFSQGNSHSEYLASMGNSWKTSCSRHSGHLAYEGMLIGVTESLTGTNAI